MLWALQCEKLAHDSLGAHRNADPGFQTEESGKMRVAEVGEDPLGRDVVHFSNVIDVNDIEEAA